MEAKPKYAKPRSLSVLMALRILFLLGFLFGCLFARTSQIAMAPVSGSVWFRGPFETGTDFPFMFSAFLFDSLFYALPIFLFGMTFLGVLVIPAAIILKGFTAFRNKLHRAFFACVSGAGFHFDFIRCIALFDFANLDFKAKEAEMNEHG